MIGLYDSTATIDALFINLKQAVLSLHCGGGAATVTMACA
jgi:hypothetical protein